MIRIPFTHLHASLVALTSTGLEALDAGYTIELDPQLSRIECHVETSLGSCTLGPAAGSELVGRCQLMLQPGAYPLTLGSEGAGELRCPAALQGDVPNTVPGEPPLLELGLEGLILSPHSEPFVLDVQGQGPIATQCEIVAGVLSLRRFGGPPLSIPLGRCRSGAQDGQALVWIDASGLHLARECESTFDLHEPRLDLDLSIRIRAQLHGDLQLPRPSLLPGLAEFDSGPTVLPCLWPEDRSLLVTLGAPSAFGDFPLGRGRARASPRAAGLFVSTYPLHLPSLPGLLLEGGGSAYQLGYRDSAL